ncbi:MAG: RecQ family zinc-binding domain-containing protein, partial [Alistipes sp.]
MVQNALKLLRQNGYMTLTDEQDNAARVMFCVSRDDLYKIRIERNDLDPFIRTLLRLYDGIFIDFRPIDEGELALWSGYTIQRVKELLKRMWQLRLIRYIPSNRSPILFFDEERLPIADLYIAPETYKRRQELMRERFAQMLAYTSNQERCRSEVLEEYFGTEHPTPCNICDICLSKRRSRRPMVSRDEIIKLLSENDLHLKELASHFRCDPSQVADATEALLTEGKISTLTNGKLTLK